MMSRGSPGGASISLPMLTVSWGPPERESISLPMPIHPAYPELLNISFSNHLQRVCQHLTGLLLLKSTEGGENGYFGCSRPVSKRHRAL